jgi:hypothetical protein
LLGERLTIGAIAGLILIAVGAWLATRRQATPSTDAGSGTGQSPGDTAMQSRPAKGGFMRLTGRVEVRPEA